MRKCSRVHRKIAAVPRPTPKAEYLNPPSHKAGDGIAGLDGAGTRPTGDTRTGDTRTGDTRTGDARTGDAIAGFMGSDDYSRFKRAKSAGS